MILCDAHVHLWPRFKTEQLLSSARENFFAQCRDSWATPPTMALLFADTARAEGFAALTALAESGSAVGRFQVRKTAEEHSLVAIDPARPGERMFLLGGRQIVTAEKIEVLSLASPAIVEDGLELAETIARVREGKGMAVLPWGVGKWLGRRGAIVSRYLSQAEPGGLFVGDNGGRPSLWPRPVLFAQAAARGIGLLSGSDPLPLPGEEDRIGSCGFCLQGACGDQYPARDLHTLLTNPSRELTNFGQGPDPFTFLKTQIALRLAK